ncbi:MAG: hypothetical protein VYC27_04905 [Candidatus Thermoplasmatota archaeon]|nr:hypothetical protein [Candidatus Thermoplasmatota archaeon]
MNRFAGAFGFALITRYARPSTHKKAKSDIQLMTICSPKKLAASNDLA